MTRADALIVGAGPAGSTAAILLARAGLRVLLLDKDRFPRDKVCGEFVSPEAVRVLHRAGVLERLLPVSARSREVLLTTESGRKVRMPIPAPPGSHGEALGIARWALDAALVEEAARCGAEIVEGFEVRRLIGPVDHPRGVAGSARRARDAASVPGSRTRLEVERASRPEEASFEADILLAADGRDSAIARLAEPGQLRRARPSPRFGLKAHFTNVAGAEGSVELHYLRGGYVGVQAVGAGIVNVCALIDRSVAGALPKDPDDLLRHLIHRSRTARESVGRADRVTDWLAVGSLVFRARGPARGGVLFLGDAAGTIDPFAGEGMSMAFRSAEIAAEEIVALLAGRSGRAGSGESAPFDTSRDHPENGFGAAPRSKGRDGPEGTAARYAVRWRREFARRITICRTLGRLLVHPALHAPLFALAGRVPSLGHIVALGTRTGQPPSGREPGGAPV